VVLIAIMVDSRAFTSRTLILATMIALAMAPGALGEGAPGKARNPLRIDPPFVRAIVQWFHALSLKRIGNLPTQVAGLPSISDLGSIERKPFFHRPDAARTAFEHGAEKPVSLLRSKIAAICSDPLEKMKILVRLKKRPAHAHDCPAKCPERLLG
jgi:hypothetical protein